MRKKDSELFENIPERGTGGNVSPEIEKTQVEYKREVCFLWPQEAEPGSKMLYECDFELKGATFRGKVPFHRMPVVASFFSFLYLFPFFVFFTVADQLACLPFLPPSLSHFCLSHLLSLPPLFPSLFK